jgi:hypothetical protein
MRELKTTKIKTGLGGSAGNKGAVVVRFKLDDTSILFMNCHLMSGKKKGSKRTDELNIIFENAFKFEGKNRVIFRIFFLTHNRISVLKSII